MSTERPPGPSGLPLIGNTLDYFRRTYDYRTECAREYGDVVYMEVMRTPTYLIVHPDDIQQVLVHDSELYKNPEFLEKQLKPVMGDGLSTTDKESWRWQRRLIQPAMHRDRILEYEQLVAETVESFVDGWSDGDVVEIDRAIERLTMRILILSLFGAGLPERKIDEVSEAIRGLFENSVFVPTWVPTPSNRRFNRSVEKINEVADELIERRREGSTAERSDLISHMVDAENADGNGMPDDIIRDNVRTFLLAGHDTVASSLTFLMDLLARHPEIQRNAAREIETVVDGDSPDREERRQLEYTAATFQETLRLYPPLHSVTREPTEPVELGDYEVPAGSLVTVNAWVPHRDPRWWDDPETFDPDRWLGETRDRPEFAYFPFGGGPHVCLGRHYARMEALFILSGFLDRFEFRTQSSEPPDLRSAFTTQPSGSIELELRGRD